MYFTTTSPLVSVLFVPSLHSYYFLENLYSFFAIVYPYVACGFCFTLYHVLYNIVGKCCNISKYAKLIHSNANKFSCRMVQPPRACHLCVYLRLKLPEMKLNDTYFASDICLRRESHYGVNDCDSDGDVTFRRSHFTFRTVTIAVSLMWRERVRGNCCHGNGDDQGDVWRSAKTIFWLSCERKRSDGCRSEVGFWSREKSLTFGQVSWKSSTGNCWHGRRRLLRPFTWTSIWMRSLRDQNNTRRRPSATK